MNSGPSEKVSKALKAIQAEINKSKSGQNFKYSNALRNLIHISFTDSLRSDFASNDLNNDEKQQLYDLVRQELDQFPNSPDKNNARAYLEQFQPLPTLSPAQAADALGNLLMTEFNHMVEQNDGNRIAELLSQAILENNTALPEATARLKNNRDYDLNDYLYAALITNQQELVDRILKHPEFEAPLESFRDRMARNPYLMSEFKARVQHPTLMKDLFTIEIESMDEFLDLLQSRRTNFMDLDLSQITPKPTKKQIDELQALVKSAPETAQAWQAEIQQFMKLHQPKQAGLGDDLAKIDRRLADSKAALSVQEQKLAKKTKVTRQLYQIASKIAKKNNPIARYLEKKLEQKYQKRVGRLKDAIQSGEAFKAKTIKENIHDYALFELSGGNTKALETYIDQINVDAKLADGSRFLDGLMALKQNDPKNWAKIEFSVMRALKKNASYQAMAENIANEAQKVEYMMLNMIRPTAPYEQWRNKLSQAEKVKLNQIVRGAKNILSPKGEPIQAKIDFAKHALEPFSKRQAEIESEIKALVLENKSLFELEPNGDIKQFAILSPIVKKDADAAAVKIYQDRHRALNAESSQIMRDKKTHESAIKAEKAKSLVALNFKDAVMGCTKEDGKLVRVPGLVERDTKPLKGMLLDNLELMNHFAQNMDHLNKFEQDFRKKTNAAPQVRDNQETTRPKAQTPQQKAFGPENYDPNNPEHWKAKVAAIKMNDAGGTDKKGTMKKNG